MTGTIGILNVGCGDTKLTFDKNDPAECIRAARIVRDMLRRGYALLVHVGERDDGRPIYQRALDFREDTCEYIIADLDPEVAAKTDKDEAHEQAATAGSEEIAAAAVEDTPKPRRGRRRAIDATKTRGVAVARSAGG